jgi:prepilin-type N-terminal cleavage/methylation domain-containing protein
MLADIGSRNVTGAARSGLLGVGISPQKKEVDILMKMFRKDEGFTLVELMVVVLIIGILVAIAIPVFNAATATAKTRACFSNQRVIEGAVQQFLANAATMTAANLEGVVESGGTDGAAALVGTDAFIKETPVCGIANGMYTLDTAGSTNCPNGATTAGGHGRYQ